MNKRSGFFQEMTSPAGCASESGLRRRGLLCVSLLNGDYILVSTVSSTTGSLSSRAFALASLWLPCPTSHGYFEYQLLPTSPALFSADFAYHVMQWISLSGVSMLALLGAEYDSAPPAKPSVFSRCPSLLRNAFFLKRARPETLHCLICLHALIHPHIPSPHPNTAILTATQHNVDVQYPPNLHQRPKAMSDSTSNDSAIFKCCRGSHDT